MSHARKGLQICRSSTRIMPTTSRETPMMVGLKLLTPNKTSNRKFSILTTMIMTGFWMISIVVRSEILAGSQIVAQMRTRTDVEILVKIPMEVITKEAIIAI